MVLGTYANLLAMEHKPINTDKLPTKKDIQPIVPLKNTTSHSRLKPSKEKVIEIPIDIVPLPNEAKKVKNGTRVLSYQPIPIAQQEPSIVKDKPVATLPPPPPLPKIIQPIKSQPAPPAPELIPTAPRIVVSTVDINREALQREDQEIAIENKAKQADTHVKDAAKLDETKELLNAQVDEIKKEFEKRNQETQKLVLEKFEQIAEKVEKIEQKQEKPQTIDEKSSHKLTLEKFEEMAERVEKIVEHQEKEKLVEHQAAVDTPTAIHGDVVAVAAPQLPIVVSTTPPKDTEKLVLKKFEEIAERVERIEQNQELQKKEIDNVQPTRPDIMEKFEKIAEKVMKIEQNQKQDEETVLAAVRHEDKSKQPAKSVPAANEAAGGSAVVQQQPPSTIAPRNIVAPKLILEKFKRIDDYIDKIEKKQKEIEMITPVTVAPAQAIVAEVDQQDAQQLVLEKFEKIAERVEKIEQKQEEQKKIKTAKAVDETQKRVLEKFEKIAERVEKIEKIQQIEKTAAAAGGPLLQKLEAIAVKLENTEQVRAINGDETMAPIVAAMVASPKKPTRLDAKVVLEKLDEIAVKLEHTDQSRANTVTEQPIVTARPTAKLDAKIVLQKLDQITGKLESTDKVTNKANVAAIATKLSKKAVSNPDAKVVLDKLDQIAKAVEKIDQKHKTNQKTVIGDNQPNPVVKMIIDNRKQVVASAGDVKNHAESKVVPVPVMLLNEKIETVALETENPIQAFRRDLLAVKIVNDTPSPTNETVQRKKRSLVDRVDVGCSKSNGLKKCYKDDAEKQLTADNLMAGGVAVGMQMIGRSLKQFDERMEQAERTADNGASR